MIRQMLYWLVHRCGLCGRLVFFTYMPECGPCYREYQDDYRDEDFTEDEKLAGWRDYPWELLEPDYEADDGEDWDELEDW